VQVIAGICVLVWVVNINRFNDPALGGWIQGKGFPDQILPATGNTNGGTE
jgi:hypothetical protein